MKPKALIGCVALMAAFSLSACSLPTTAGAGTQSNGALPAKDVSAQEGSKTLLGTLQTDPKLAALVPAGFQGKKLVVGANLQSPPTGFLAEDSTTPIGLDIDIITAAAKTLGLEVSVQNMAFNTLITSLQTKRVNVTIANMNDNKVRQEKIDFVDYFNSGMKFLVKKDNPSGIKSVEDLCGKTAGAVVGAAAVDWVQKTATPACTAKGKPEVKVSTNEINTQLYTDLKTSRIDLVVDDLPLLSYVAETSAGGGDFQLADNELIDPVPYGIGFNKEDPQLRDAVQAAVQKMMDDGTYAKILKNWQVTAGARTTATINGGE